LRELDTQTAMARSTSELGKCISTAFTFNPYDVPFALVYFCSTEYGTSLLHGGTGSTGLTRRSSLNSTAHSGSVAASDKTDPAIWVYRLQDTVGIPQAHHLAPEVVEIHLNELDQDEVHLWPFRRMAELQTAIDLPNLPSESLEGVIPQGWPELPGHAIAVPIMGARDYEGKGVMMGMLVLGTNPRRGFDGTYQTFATMCGRQIAAAMTLVKSIEEEAGRADELAALNRDRTSFFNSVSHELRTPLTLILGPLEECLDDPSLSQQHKGRLEIVGRNARRLLRLVNSLLDFSRVEAGKMASSFRETDLQKFTADLASLFRSAIEKGGVKYTVDVRGKHRPVWVDRDMWEVRSRCLRF
jgi:GAF domain-containing protein